MSKDPVCGTMISENQAPEKSEFKGQTYYFDSLRCKAFFDIDPGKYTGEEAKELPASFGGHAD